MTDTVDVEPSSYIAASKIFGAEVAEQIRSVTSTLQSALDGTGAMAGSDPGGQQWAASYDPVAAATAQAVTDLANAAYKLGAMLEMTGFNHGRANDASDPRGTVTTDTTAYSSPVQLEQCWEPPSANGGSGAPPTGWGLVASAVQAAVGCVWPNGSPVTLRAAGHAWTAAANALTTAAGDIPRAVQAVRYQQSAEVADAVTVCQAAQHHIDDVAESCRGLASACAELADHIDRAHKDVQDELEDLVAATVAIEGAGLLVGIFTAGIGEGAAQIAEAARVTLAATRIGAILTRLTEYAATARTVLVGLGSKIAEVTSRVSRILKASTETAKTETQAAKAGKTLEEVAAEEKAVATSTQGAKDGWLSRPANNGKGTVWQKPGSVGDANSVRVMEPGADSRYPNGYVKFTNEHNQPIKLDGKPGNRAETHIPRNADGSYPTPEGW